MRPLVKVWEYNSNPSLANIHIKNSEGHFFPKPINMLLALLNWK